MGKDYKGKTDRESYGVEDLKRALVVLKDGQSYCFAKKIAFGIGRRTYRDTLNDKSASTYSTNCGKI